MVSKITKKEFEGLKSEIGFTTPELCHFVYNKTEGRCILRASHIDGALERTGTISSALTGLFLMAIDEMKAIKNGKH